MASKQGFITTIPSQVVAGTSATIDVPPGGAVRDATGKFATITTLTAHGLSPGDVAVIAGVDDSTFNATAQVIAATTFQLSYANTGALSATSGNGTVTGSIASQPNYYDGGLIKWTSGLNTGLAMEIKSYNPATQLLLLFLEMPFAIGVNDTFDIWPGCDKKLDTCKNKFNNIANFRGEPYLPGQDIFLLYPDLGK